MIFSKDSVQNLLKDLSRQRWRATLWASLTLCSIYDEYGYSIAMILTRPLERSEEATKVTLWASLILCPILDEYWYSKAMILTKPVERSKQATMATL